MEKLRMPFLTKVVVVAALYYGISPRRPHKFNFVAGLRQPPLAAISARLGENSMVLRKEQSSGSCGATHSSWQPWQGELGPKTSLAREGHMTYPTGLLPSALV